MQQSAVGQISALDESGIISQQLRPLKTMEGRIWLEYSIRQITQYDECYVDPL